MAASTNELSPVLRDISLALHSHPELAYNEVFAHEKLTSYLQNLGFDVKKSAYGLATAFEAKVGTGGRQVVFCAEYDALPEIGHACGHNLIAIASLGAFLAAAHVLSSTGSPGRLRLLGTPAEEGRGGKVDLIEAGEFKPATDIAASLMAHPSTHRTISDDPSVSRCSAFDLIASIGFHVEFYGKAAHAAGEPWNGVNALDAAVSAYNNISLLRQQIHPDERIHGVILDGGTVPNVITDYTRMNWFIRASTIDKAEVLERRVNACINAAAAATGCEVKWEYTENKYKDVVSNKTLCNVYAKDMAQFGEKVLPIMEKKFIASTDMGNVSHEVPSFHGAFTIPTASEVAIHSRPFAAAAATQEAHEAAIKSAKGMSMLALRVILDEEISTSTRQDFKAR